MFLLMRMTVAMRRLVLVSMISRVATFVIMVVVIRKNSMSVRWRPEILMV
jgi:hypothetical protein